MPKFYFSCDKATMVVPLQATTLNNAQIEAQRVEDRDNGLYDGIYVFNKKSNSYQMVSIRFLWDCCEIYGWTEWKRVINEVVDKRYLLKGTCVKLEWPGENEQMELIS